MDEPEPNEPEPNDEVNTLFKIVQNTKLTYFEKDTEIAKYIDGYNTITQDSELRYIDYYIKQGGYPYTEKFNKYMIESDKVLLENKNESLRYVNIGKLYKNYRCNNNKYNERLKAHINNLHKIRVWNKQVLKTKMNKLINDSTKLIGGCDDTLIEQYLIKSPTNRITESAQKMASSIKKSITKAPEKAQQWLFNEPNKTPEEKIISERVVVSSIINNVRAQLTGFMRLIKENTVSAKEYKYIEKVMPDHWATRPLVLATVSVILSNISTNANIPAKLAENSSIIETAKFNNVTALDFAKQIVGTVTPFLGIMVEFLRVKIKESETIKQFSLNNKILSEYSDEKNKYYNIRQPVQEYCSYSNKQYYIERFQRVTSLIDSYNKLCDTYYNEIIDLCYDYNNVYSIVCGVKEIKLNDDIVEEKVNDEPITDNQINNILSKIRKCTGTALQEYRRQNR